MESSPLAAMHPQQVPSWSSRKDVYHGFQTYNPLSFDFKTMSMAQHKPARRDYFSLRPARGSSPTASLTADLDANFHIDKSPQAPTPRRSLFTTDLFKPREDAVMSRLNTPPVDLEPSGTPPILSSPPYCDAMDISPLPHKIPHFVAQITLPSPSPEPTPSDGDLISPNDLTPGLSDDPTPPAATPAFLELPDRARRPVTRPALTRTKVGSAYGIPDRPSSSETQLPPFRFGHFGHVASSGLTCSSTPSLLGSFSETPVDDVRLSGLSSMLPPPRRQSSLSVSNRSMGSPSSNHVRKPSAGRGAFVRPQRKLIRRSLSMFQHPDDVMKEEPQPSALDSVMDMESDHTLKLPHFIPEGEPDSLPRITQQTMVDVLDSKFNKHYDRIMIVDCRFEYEYSGGHIDNAVNFNDKQQLAQELFGSDVPANTCLILHCEYSVHRAPLTAKFIRGHDRSVNAANYPKLTYPELYLLDGGYSKFFAEHRSKCYPQNYVEMNDQRHHQECERGMAKVKATGRQKLFRNQTFAFGQSNDEMEDSPTGQARATMKHQNSYPAFRVGEDIAQGIGQSFQRRMASY